MGTFKSAQKSAKKSVFANKSAQKSTLKSTFGSSEPICQTRHMPACSTNNQPKDNAHRKKNKTRSYETPLLI